MTLAEAYDAYVRKLREVDPKGILTAFARDLRPDGWLVEVKFRSILVSPPERAPPQEETLFEESVGTVCSNCGSLISGVGCVPCRECGTMSGGCS